MIYLRQRIADPICKEAVSDLERARRYMRALSWTWFTPENLQIAAGLSIGVPALARKMRLWRQQSLLESRLRDGKQYKEYKWIDTSK